MTEPSEPNPPTERPGWAPDALTLLMGLISLAAAAMALVGWAPGLPLFDVRWVLAGGAVLIGLLLLAGTLRSPRGRR